MPSSIYTHPTITHWERRWSCDSITLDDLIVVRCGLITYAVCFGHQFVVQLPLAHQVPMAWDRAEEQLSGKPSVVNAFLDWLLSLDLVYRDGPSFSASSTICSDGDSARPTPTGWRSG